MTFKEQALASLPSQIGQRLEARGIVHGEDFFGASVHIDEWGKDSYSYISDRDIFDAHVTVMRGLGSRVFEIDTVICEACGGVIPTDLVVRTANIMREEARVPRVKNVFSLRPKGEDAFFVENFVASRNNEKRSFGKTLVVTELIRNGTGLRRLADILKKYEKYGLKFDVASISAVKKETIPALMSEYGIEIISVGEMNLLGTGEVFHRRSFNGIKQGDYHSGSAHPLIDDKRDRDEICLSRKVVEVMAQEAAKIV